MKGLPSARAFSEKIQGIASAVACDVVPKFGLVGFLGLPTLRVRLASGVSKNGNFSWEFMGINWNHGRRQGFKNTKVKNEGPSQPAPC